jgi:hypothetical protein
VQLRHRKTEVCAPRCWIISEFSPHAGSDSSASFTPWSGSFLIRHRFAHVAHAQAAGSPVARPAKPSVALNMAEALASSFRSAARTL